MSIATVQGFASILDATSTSSGTSISKAFGSNVTAGNAIIVVVRNKSGSIPGTQAYAHDIQDTLGNTYVLAVQDFLPATSESIEFYYAKNISGGANTVTATWASAVDRRTITIFEVSGLDTTTPLVGTNSGTGNSATPSAGSVTSTGEAIFFAAAVNDNPYLPISSGTGWTGIHSGAVWGYAEYEYRIQTSGATESGDFSQSATNWGAVIAAFKAASSGGGTTTSYLPLMGCG